MGEPDAPPASPRSSDPVDELSPLLSEPVEGTVHARDAEGEVMQTLAAGIEEASDGGGGVRRFEELDMRVPHLNERDPHLLGRNDLGDAGRESETVLVRRHGGLERADGNAHMVQLHGERPLELTGRTVFAEERAPHIRHFAERRSGPHRGEHERHHIFTAFGG